jgi:hypothetical protein
MNTAAMTQPTPQDTTTGRWLHNPATGEIGHILRAAGDGTEIEVDLWLQPGAAVARAHIHDNFIERFEVRAGQVGFLIEGSERVVRAGDDPVEVPAGTLHDWWNSGDGIAQIRGTVVTAPEGRGTPAARFVSMIEALWSLGALGRVNQEGLPDPLWLAAIAREYRDAIRFVQPPAAVQTALFGPLATIARRTGRDPLAPELHGLNGACAIPDPGEAGLAELLARRVGARDSRGHG